MSVKRSGNRIDFTGADASAFAKRVLPSMKKKEENTQPANGWISIKGKDKPIDGEKYLVTQFDVNETNYKETDYKNRVWIGSYQKCSKTFWTDDLLQIHGVLFYQPLPGRP